MSTAHKAELHPKEKFKLGDLYGRVYGGGLGMGILFLVITVGIGLTKGDHMNRFFQSYLVGLTYFLSIALGALFFVVLQHLVKARWSVVVRRIAEILTATFPMLFVLSLGILVPMLIGEMGPYHHWLHPDPNDHLLHDKAPWLNAPFFAVRVLIYFALWIFLSRLFFKKSVEQDDSGDAGITAKLQRWSAPGIIVYALTACFAAFDLLMSVDPHWFSTIFGVYYFAGSAIGVFATLILVAMALQKSGRLTHSITVEHYHDLGKLLFAFVFFWSYIGFSQFMLIWYANIPEETVWFQSRMFTDWKYLSLLLLFGHCIFPFLCMLSRWTKRWLKVLAFFSTWMLVMHFFDLLWLVLPAHEANPQGLGEMFSIMDVTALLGVGGLFVAAAARAAAKVNLIPVKDPALGDSLRFENF
jgi:hypothetical protein